MIHIVVGTRAQFLKMAPIMLAMEKKQMQWRWIYTAQHKDTMDQLIAGFAIKPPDKVLFEWNAEAKTMGKMAFWLLKAMVCLIREKKAILDGHTGPENVVLTHGDTITAWWGALLGKLGGCKVMHVESGLRSFNLFEPFPEEINRLLTFCLSDMYACPGKWAVGNLRRFKGDKINTYHNTQLETLHYGIKRIHLSPLELPQGRYAVVSVHRYENIFKKKRFAKILGLIETISKDFHVIFVMHPATKNRLNESELRNRIVGNSRISFLDRLDHLSFLKLINTAEFVATDGGGNQEELYHMGKPCLLLRANTERIEGVDENTVISGLDPTLVTDFLNNYEKYRRDRIPLENEPSKIIIDYLMDKGYSG